MKNHLGAPRRVGVEIEFAALSARDAARAVQDLFGGTVSERDPHRFTITGTALGDFRTELDSQYLHREAPGRDAEPGEPSSEFGLLLSDFQEILQEFLGEVGALVIPCEVVCPPVLVPALEQIDTLLRALRERGALGTEKSLLYAFGAQLNPDIAEKSAEYIMSVLKAYLLLSDWLRAEISVHIKRRLLAFASPFPEEYALLAVRPDYWPDLGTLISDYLIFNPTRNRELDLLPLFSWLDPEPVVRAARDVRIKGRPAFHYRLPDARLGDPGWTISQEWNRWCRVERLAGNGDILADMGQAYLRNSRRPFPEDWAPLAREWLVHLQ